MGGLPCARACAFPCAHGVWWDTIEQLILEVVPQRSSHMGGPHIARAPVLLTAHIATSTSPGHKHLQVKTASSRVVRTELPQAAQPVYIRPAQKVVTCFVVVSKYVGKACIVRSVLVRTSRSSKRVSFFFIRVFLYFLTAAARRARRRATPRRCSL